MERVPLDAGLAGLTRSEWYNSLRPFWRHAFSDQTRSRTHLHRPACRPNPCDTRIAGASVHRPQLSLIGRWRRAFHVSRNSPSRARTYDLAVNSRSLYRLSYRGIPTRALQQRRGLVQIIVHQRMDFNNFVKISPGWPIGQPRSSGQPCNRRVSYPACDFLVCALVWRALSDPTTGKSLGFQLIAKQ